MTSGFVEIPLDTWTGNSSSIGEEPVSSDVTIRRSATSGLVSHAKQGIITFTNVLQDHDTVVLVCCISEWKPDITCTWEERDTVVILEITLFLVASFPGPAQKSILWVGPGDEAMFLVWFWSEAVWRSHLQYRAMFRSHFWQLRCVQKLPFLASFGNKSCQKWQLCQGSFAVFGNLYAMPDFFFQFWQSIKFTCLLKVAKNGNFGCYYRFAIIGNICSSSKSSQMTTALPYIPSGSIGKDSLHIWPFLATLCLVTFCQFWRKVFFSPVC